MKKRILAFAISVLMIMGTFALSAFAAETVDTNITFSVDQVTVDADATEVTVGLWITNLTDEDDLGTVDFRVQYDDTKLRQTDLYCVIGTGRNAEYYGASNFSGYQFSPPGGTVNPIVFLAWSTETENPCWDTAWEMNTYEFAFIDFEFIGDWQGRTPLVVSHGDVLRRSDDKHYTSINMVDGWIQRGEYTEEEEPADTLTVAAEGNGTVDATIAGTATTGITTATSFAPAAGDAVTLEAKGEGFKYWKNALSGAIISDSATLSWTDAGSVRSLVAVFEVEAATTHAVIFKDSRTGKIVSTLDVADGTVLDDADLPADPSFLGYVFTGWKVAVEGQQSVYAVDYTVNADTEVYAAYTADTANTNVLTVNDGTRTGTFNRNYASIATVYADIENFSYWVDGEGTIVSLDPIYKFSMPNSDVTLTAVANATDAPAALLAVVDNVLDNGKIYTTFTRDLADGYTFVEAGVLYTRNATEDDLVVPKANQAVTQGISSAADDASVYGFVKDVTGKAGTWLVRGYMVYADANGDLQTIYTAVESVVVA